MNIPLSIGHYKGRSGAANAMELVNMILEADSEGGAAPYTLFGTPGCKEYIDTGVIGSGRGGFSIPGKVLFVVGNYVFLINTSSQTAAHIYTISTTSGAIQWAENPDQVMFVDGTYGYVYTKSTQVVAKITDGDFPTPLSCTFKDGFGVVVAADSGKFFVSAIGDFTSWDALAFATAEYEPDNLVSCLASHESLFAFGSKTTQTYYNSGNSSFPFDNRQGANLQIGCGATNSPAKGENIIFWLDNHGIVRKLDGYSQQIISTRQIDYMISKLSTFADARGFVYVQEGKTFYVLIFPTDGLSLVYDMSVGGWHKRASYANDGLWRAAWIAQEGSLILAGDHSNGKIYQLDPDTFTDNSFPIKWHFTLQNINSEDQMLAHEMLSLKIDGGVGLSSGDDPKLWMTYSDDNGHTWSREKWRSMGKIGEYSKRIKFFNLGRSRGRIYKFSGTDPVRKLIVSAKLKGRELGY